MIKDSKLRETQNGPILIVRQEFSLTNASGLGGDEHGSGISFSKNRQTYGRNH